MQIPENTCKPDMRGALVAKPTCARVTRESTGNENTGLLHFQSIMPCFPGHLLSFNFIYFIASKSRYSSILFNKKSMTFKDRKRNSSTFKALKLDSWNSRVFKGFQEAYEPCMVEKFLLKRISSILIPKSSAKNTRKTNLKRRNRITFPPPDEILQRSERKRKNKAIILRKIAFQLCKFSTNLVRASGRSRKKKSNFAGFSGTNSWKKRPISREIRGNFRG